MKLLPVLPVALFLCTSAPAALTGHWPLDGNRSNTVTGAVAALGGTGGGVQTYVAGSGQLGQAFSFNGSTYLTAGGAGTLNNTAYTKAAWVRRNNANTANNVISGTAASQHAFWVNNGNSFRVASGHNGAWFSVTDNVTMPTNTWFHVAVTYNAAENGGTLRLYKNGAPVTGTPVATGIAPPAGGGEVQIGGHNGGNFLNGAVDDAAVWNHTLSAAEINQLYRAGLHRVNAAGAGAFQYRVYDLVPEAAGFEIVHDLLIPDSLTLGTTLRATYTLDRTATFANDGFDRVGYFMELTTAATNRWVWVSADPFTSDISKLGVPSIATGAIFQQRLTNMNVRAGGPYVAQGDGLATGNMEFWGHNYSQANGAAVPNASASTYDAGDTPSTSGTYGSMQIHNHAPGGGTVPQTVFAYNRWGAGGSSEVGIGNAPSGNPDYTFSNNAPTHTYKNLLVLARRIDLPDMVWSNRVENLQLLPRDPGTNQALARLDGAVASPGCAEISLGVTRLGAPFTNLTQSLVYGGGGRAPFSFAVPVTAELADYDFTVRVLRAGTNHVVHTAQDVVSGDVYLVNGQSNAEARSFSGSANGERSPWVRSFGYRTETSSLLLANLAWSQAEGDAVEGLGAVGQWPLRMARVLVESNAVPVAVINGARGGQPIGYFRRNDSNPEDLTLNYGRLLFLCRQAGVDQQARAMLWYQGESDSGNAPVHEQGFLEIYRRWLDDYPSLEKVYVVQLHTGCGTIVPRWTAELRDRQRVWPDLYDRLAVTSTTGLPQHTDNCHYAWLTGYKVLGEQMAALVRRDLLGAVLPAEIDAPNPDTAWYADGTGTRVRVRTRNPADALTADPGIGADFRMEGLTNAVVTAVTASGNEFELTFDRDVRAGTGLSFSGHTGGAPYLRNSRGIGLLSFHNQPVLAGLALPAPPTGLRAIPVATNRIDLAWTASPDASRYLVRRDGVTVDEAFSPVWIDFTATPGTALAYQVAAVSPLGTSGWSSVVNATTAEFPVFPLVPEAADYEVLYAIDLPASLSLGATGEAPYRVDRSGQITAGVQRVAYFMELQDEPGRELRWVYASMNAFTNDTRFLGIPSRLKGPVFQQIVTDVNVLASPNTSVLPGWHLATANLEFWGWNYSGANALAVPNASATLYDHGDQFSTGGTYGSMQLHNHDLDGAGPGTAAQTIFAYNAWGTANNDDLGIGTNPNAGLAGAGGNQGLDYTFSGSAQAWNTRRLTVLVRTDADSDGLPDAWERANLGGLGATGAQDSDGDGVSNADEHRAGTDPDAAASFPALNIIGGAFTNRVGLAFSTVPGRLYDVEYKLDLAAPAWTPLETGLTGNGVPVLLAPTNSAPRTYYRLGIRTP